MPEPTLPPPPLPPVPVVPPEGWTPQQWQSHLDSQAMAAAVTAQTAAIRDNVAAVREHMQRLAELHANTPAGDGCGCVPMADVLELVRIVLRQEPTP